MLPFDPLSGTLPVLNPGDLFEGSFRDRAGLLPASSTDVILAGMGVDVDVVLGGYNSNAIKLPTAASGTFAGVISSHCIKTPLEIALLGGTVDRVVPGQDVLLHTGDHGVVVLIVQNVSALADAYLVFSGADAGKFRGDDAGTYPIYKLTLVSAGAGAIGFSVTVNGQTSSIFTKTSVSKAADALYLAAAYNDSALAAAYGAASVDGSNDIVITASSYYAHTFTDASAGGNSITPSTTQPMVAPTARIVPGAKWGIAGTAVNGYGFLRLPAIV